MRNLPRSQRGGGNAPNLATTIAHWPTPMAGTPAQNGNSMAGNSGFSRKAETLAADLWMTPRTVAGEYTRDRGQKGAERPTLEGQGAMWTTPSATDGTRGGTGITEAMSGSSLTQKVNQWPTPKGLTGGPNSKREERGAGGPDLQEMAGAWPTPASRDHKGENSPDHLTNGTGRLHLDQLPNAVAFLFSRPAPETEAHGRLSWPQTLIVRHLLRAAMSLPPRSISRPHSPPTRRKPLNPHYAAYREARAWERWSAKRLHWWTKRRLSPAFVTWLMGWPSGHALCACSAMEFTHWQRQMRGALSALPMASGPWIWKPQAVTQAPVQMAMEW